jgi:hemoglobin
MQRLRWWRTLPLAALALALLAGAGRAAEDKAAPLESKALDTALYNNLRDVINRGADLYNSGDWAGCYRLYEGALMAVKPLLDHRKGLQAEITKGITDAERDPVLYRRAFVLRSVIDKIRNEVNPNPKPAPKAETPVARSLWDRLGGEKGVQKIVDDLVEKVTADPRVDFTRGGKVKLTPNDVAKLKKDLVEQISTWTGGPYRYTGPDMKQAHKDMGITNAQYDAFVADTREVLELNSAPADDVSAIIKALNDYRKDIVQAKVETPPAPEGKKTLWDRLGGEAGVTKVVNDLVAAVANDPKVDFFRDGRYKLDAAGVARLKKLVVEQVSSLTGGPLKYDGLAMKEAHKGMAITDAQFDAFMDHVKEVLEKNKVASADVATILAAYNGYRKDVVQPAKKTEKEEKKSEDKKPGGLASLSGHVTYKGQPVPGATITLKSEGGKTYSAPLAEDGTYALKGLPHGAYKVGVSTKGPKAAEAKAAPRAVAIPAKYGDPETSGLTLNIAEDVQVHNISLD